MAAPNGLVDSETAAKAKLREILRDHAEGLTVTSGADTVEDAVRDWLAYGLAGRSAATVANYTTSPKPGSSARWAVDGCGTCPRRTSTAGSAAQADEVSTRTLRLMHSILNRAVVRAMARNKVQRNVVALCSVPVGQEGRPSKSLTLPQAEALLAAAEDTPLHAYVVLSLLTGARTEEVRALRWERRRPRRQPAQHSPGPPVDLRAALGPTRRRHQDPQVATAHRHPHPVRRRPHRAPRQPRSLPDGRRAGLRHPQRNRTGPHNVRRAFRRIVAAAGLDPTAWTPRELRHSFVSLLSDSGMPSSRSPGCSATTAPPSPSGCTATNSAPSSRKAPPRWTASSASVRRRSHSA